jgi:hypothetical protein
VKAKLYQCVTGRDKGKWTYRYALYYPPHQIAMKGELHGPAKNRPYGIHWGGGGLGGPKASLDAVLKTEDSCLCQKLNSNSSLLRPVV